MKIIVKIFKYLSFIVLFFVIGIILALSFIKIQSIKEASSYKTNMYKISKNIFQDGLIFRDLNKNGRLDPYEDYRVQIDERVNNLLNQMTIEEKAGTMFFNIAVMDNNGEFIETTPIFTDFSTFFLSHTYGTTLKMMFGNNLNHFNIVQGFSPEVTARWNNNIQKKAESTRLGIPVTIGSDLRQYFGKNFISMKQNRMTIWPEQIGFAAIGDTVLMRQFANIVREEYKAVGIRVALHPAVDLSTEPRWARCSNTFGEDASLATKLIPPYIEGFQNGKHLNESGVACMTKHFTGAGPQTGGIDSHFDIQKEQAYPGNNFNYHLKPFESAFFSNTASIMTYYGIPTNQTSENVGFAFNRQIITGLLRNKYNFDGIICTDWGLINDSQVGPFLWKARSWGVENLSRHDKVLKILNAGCDQFGGENCPELIVNLVRSGRITESRIDQSVKRILKQKFILGLFDNPYIEPSKALEIVGKPAWQAIGKSAQMRSLTLLKNDENILPLKTQKYKIFIKNIDKKFANKYGTVVNNISDADFAIVRYDSPWYPLDVKNNSAKFLINLFHHGDLNFKGDERDEILKICKSKPTIFNIYLERPAVFPEINDVAKAVIANYGITDEALLEVIFGKSKPEGSLPFELPSSMTAVKNQKEDLPYDSKNPLYKFGYGLRYK